MKKYNIPTMEISLFDAEVVSTGETSLTQESAKMAQFNQEMAEISTNGGIAKTISWTNLDWTY